MITRFALLGLAMFVGVVSGQHPSGPEFNLFCRILAEANNMMYGPDYVYDENVDKEIIKEMTVLFNATTDDMKDFGNSLWDTKEFLKEHPPPTDPKNREDAHREIGNLIDKGERKIRENKEIAEKVNEKIKEAKLSVARGLYGEHVKEVPKDYENLTEILKNTGSIFVDDKNAANSCGNGGTKETGKTLINDLFCVCAGDPKDAHGPCHPKIWPPRSWQGHRECCKKSNNCCTKNKCCNCGWTQIKFGLGNPHGTPELVTSFNESFQKIERVCREEMIQSNVKPEKMDALLREYVGMIEMGSAKTEKTTKKIFGHSGRTKNRQQVTECDGSGKGGGADDPEKNNANICVDYSKTLEGDKEIPWHTKFKNYTNIMKSAKQLEGQILKNRAALLLLKSQAWVAYSREKDDETSNLDDMNVSHLFDGDKASDKKDTMAENKQGEPTSQEREYIDVPSQSTQGSQPSQPAPSNAGGRQYTYISSTESTQEEAQQAPAGGGEPKYIYVSSTGTPSQPTPPPETPSPTQQDPPTQSAKRLREENKTGE